MISRTQERLGTKKFFDEVTFSALAWPSKSVRLERDTLQDYCQRSATAGISVAELYHENSKLFRRMLSELAVTRVDAGQVRSEFLERRSAVVRSTPEAHLEPPWKQVLSSVVRETQPGLFYAIELRLAAPNALLFHEPVSDRSQLVKRFSKIDTDMLRAALALTAGPGNPDPQGSVLFVIGSFARNDLLFGPRGYRRTLIEAGLVTEKVLRITECSGLSPRLFLEFADRDLDLLLEADGIEEGVIAAVALQNGNDVD